MSKLKLGERLVVSALIIGFALLLGVNIAHGNRFPLGNLLVDFHLDSAPTKLPRHENAPITFWGSGDFHTKDGTTPPKLQRMTIEVDKFGELDTRGIPVCTKDMLTATAVALARRKCHGAILGVGTGIGIIEFPEQAPIPATTPLTFFNGPVVDGDPTLIVHAYLSVPVPTTYLVRLRIERIHRGVYGFRIDSKFPPIAGGYGSITHFDFKFARKWTYRGESLSYINARCAIGHLQAHFMAEFSDGSKLEGTFVHPCQVR